MHRDNIVATPTIAMLTAILAVFLLISATEVNARLLDPASPGFGGSTRGENYDELVDALYSSGNVTTTIPTAAGKALWVPWFSTSSQCTVKELQKGVACDAGTIDFEHNCMVSDELSQVGILVAMGDVQSRMDEYYSTLLATKSTNGNIPSWRTYRNGDTIESCKEGINSNCDTASDATARMIIALYTASDNKLFADEAKKAQYKQLADRLASDFVEYELVQSCKPSSLGYGDICYWLAAGSEAKRGGMGKTDFAYTGYFPDTITAMLQACSQNDDRKYCEIAGNLTLNYLEAAKFDGSTFSAPPGRSFKWIYVDGIPTAQCTNTCNPVQWDGADAPRAVALCQAQYYADTIGYELPGLRQYCELWSEKYMQNPGYAPIQYTPQGSAVRADDSYFAQGLQALFQLGANKKLFEPSLDSALSHYSTSTRTFDWTVCFGVYTQAFPMRALGVGLGRNAEAFPPLKPACTPSEEICDTLDNDCDGQVDEGDVCSVWYKDADGDGFGTATTTANGAIAPAGYVSNRLDCNDGAAAINPTAKEVCDLKDNNCDGQPDEGNTCSGYACLSSVKEAPVSCTGTITSDSWNGCRTVLCSSATGTTKVLGCDKTGHFELYKQSSTGTPPTVCLAGTCISNGGYAKSGSTPMCVQNTTAPAVALELKVTAQQLSESSFSFSCNAGGFMPNSYEWNFGDGKSLNTTQGSTSYKYGASGSFTVRCAAHSSTSQLSNTTIVKASVAQHCASSVKDLPVSCTGGTVTKDSLSGSCRTIACSNGAASMQAKACDKAGYFEVYKQSQTGTLVKSICFGSTCVSSNGYAKSTAYPVCQVG